MTLSSLDSALFGPLVTSDPMRSVFNERRLIGFMIEVEAALARAQAQAGLVPPDLASAIEGVSVADLDIASIGAATELAGVPTIPFVKALQEALPPALEPHLHKGATTQDILDTAFVLQMRQGLDLLAMDLGPTLESLITLTSRTRALACIGRTYGQHAAPVTFGFKTAGWLAGLVFVASGLRGLRERVLVASLGGPVGTLAAMGERGPGVLEAFAADLGLKATAMTWHTQRGRMVELAAWLAQLVGALAKMATDIVHLASTEVGEVSEPFMPGRGGSTAMPHKRNPVSSTIILAAHQAAPGLLASVTSGMAAAHERPAGAWHGEWHALPPLFGLAAGALKEARRLSDGLQVHPERMAANLALTRGMLYADRIAGRLAPRLGRDAAHALVEEAAAIVRETGRPLVDVMADDPRLAGVNLTDMIDPAPAIAAAQPWIERVLAEAGPLRRQFP